MEQLLVTLIGKILIDLMHESDSSDDDEEITILLNLITDERWPCDLRPPVENYMEYVIAHFSDSVLKSHFR